MNSPGTSDILGSIYEELLGAPNDDETCVYGHLWREQSSKFQAAEPASGSGSAPSSAAASGEIGTIKTLLEKADAAQSERQRQRLLRAERLASVAEVATTAAAAPKKARGRPPGAKNKAKAAPHVFAPSPAVVTEELHPVAAAPAPAVAEEPSTAEAAEECARA